MSNFKLGFPYIQKEATQTATHTGATARPFTNLFSGSRSERSELATATSDCMTLNYDLGVSTATSNFLAIMRAKLLAGAGCTGVRLRGSSVSGLTLPVTPTAWFDANRGVTTVTGAVSQWNDLSGNGYHAVQGTATNRPLLSRADNRENRIFYSETLTDATWTKTNVTAVDSVGVNPRGYKYSTLTNTAINAAHRAQQSIVIPATTIVFSAEFESGIAGTHLHLAIQDYFICVFNTSGTPSFTFNSNGSGTCTQIDLGGGWFRCVATYNATSGAGASKAIRVIVGNGVTDTYLGSTSEFIRVGAIYLCPSTSSGYAATTSYEQRAGVNGNKSLVFDGNDNRLDATFPNIPQPFTIFAVVKADFTTAPTFDRFIYNGRGGANYQIGYYNTAGQLALFNGSNLLATRTAGTLEVLAFTSNTTSSTIHANGTSIASGTSGTTADSMVGVAIGGDKTSLTSRAWLGRICEFLIFNTALGTSDRQAIEAYLTTKYITTPLASVDFPATYNGGNSEDYLTTFTESAAFRHYWLQFNTESSTKYPVSKAFFGKALDLGRDPLLPISLSRTRQNAWSREAAYSTTLNFNPIADTKREELLDLIKESDVLPVVALDPSEYVLNDTQGIHCKIRDHNIEPFYGSDNNVAISIEEEI
jgi:hypothetical protein